MITSPVLKPTITCNEFAEAEQAVLVDPTFQEPVFRHHVIKDMRLIMAFIWIVGYYGEEESKGIHPLVVLFAVTQRATATLDHVEGIYPPRCRP